MAAESNSTESPGNAFALSNPPLQMRLPNLEFIYRLECEMGKQNTAVGSPFGGTQTRVIMPIVGGTVNGPQISGTIQHMSGADWGTVIDGTDLMQLNARYTLQTDDGHFIFVRSKGIFAPHVEDFFANGRPDNIGQSDVDWFTRLQFEAGPGPYNWMNGIFAIGVLSKQEKRINIDAYQVTNLVNTMPRDRTASKPT